MEKKERVDCIECGTSYYKLFLLGKQGAINICPMCGAPIDFEEETPSHNEEPVEKTTYYYYDDGSATLDDMLFEDWTPIYTFEAVDMEDAERQLKEVCPNSPLFQSNITPKVMCPRCFSTSFQFVPRRYSLLTGFATNKLDRMCNNCGKRF